MKKILKDKLWVVIVFCFLFVLSSSNAFAWGRGHESHYYRDGRWYRHGWFGFDVAVSALTIGAVVEVLPIGYRTIVVGGTPYYYYEGYYYRHYPYGYVVVPEPVVVAVEPAPAPVIANTPAKPANAITINVPNSKGGFTPVALVKHGNGYLGPQGEYYQGHPTVEELKVLYGN